MNMNEQFSLFDGEILKEQGMNLAAKNKEYELGIARFIATRIALSRKDRCCWIDLVQEKLLKKRIRLGNAAGMVFRSKDWVFTGKYRRSCRTTNHARIIRIWKLI